MPLSKEQWVTFVGGGMMAEAMIRGMLVKQLCVPSQVHVSDPLISRRDYLQRELGVTVCATNREGVHGAPVVVLAVKPQVLGAVLAELAGAVEPTAVVLSIVAGARVARIRKATGVAAVVRIMPNTPAQVGEGISAWTATAETSPQQGDLAREIVACLGQEVHVEDEDHIDMATALSGSGPAYVFLFLEALIDAGVRLGFARSVAEKLALQTIKGSAVFAQQSALHPAVLRNMVTSPGGTTAEGLHYLEKGAIRAIVAEAILAAYQKAKYLGGLSNE